MPVYCARWPDASFSIVDADDEDSAYIQFDEFGGEPAEVWELGSCAVDFELTDNGTFRLGEFGSRMRQEILEKAYPSLDKALTTVLLAEHDPEDEEDMSEHPAVRDLLTKAVVAERDRFAGLKPRPARTELGKDIQRQVTGSGRYVDALVNERTKKLLGKHTPDPEKKPN